MRNEDRGVAGHLRVTPRDFVESLRAPLWLRFEPRAKVNECRLQEIEGWLWAEKQWPTWGVGGVAFVLKAREAAMAERFEAWLDSLPPVSPSARPGAVVPSISSSTDSTSPI